MTQMWSADVYQRNAAFVPAFGQELIGWLDPKPGERILDLGCAVGRTTVALKERFQVSLSGEVYDTPCHRQPVFKEWAAGEFPVADDVCSRHVCLPIYPGMTEDEIDQVVLALRETLSRRIASCASE